MAGDECVAMVIPAMEFYIFENHTADLGSIKTLNCQEETLDSHNRIKSNYVFADWF